jgi:hypothetical protein
VTPAALKSGKLLEMGKSSPHATAMDGRVTMRFFGMVIAIESTTNVPPARISVVEDCVKL